MELSLSGLEREFAALALSGVTETGKELGRGSYGEVREANWLGTPCATKRVHSLLMSQAGAADGGKISRDFVRECRTWKDLRHPHIVQLLGVVFERASPLPVLVMERLSTSLRRFLEDHTKEEFPLSRKATVLHHVALGLAYLHSQKHIHRDLSTNNILLDTDSWKAKITDFGVTRVLDTTRSRMTGSLVPGTQAFMPPEVFEIPAQFSDKVDIFSFGCVTISTLTHQWPEPGPAKRREGGKVIGLTECQRREKYLAVFTLQEKEMFLRLTEQCLHEDPSSRPSSGAVVEELARIRDEARKGSTGETSAVPDQLTGVPTARGGLPPIQVLPYQTYSLLDLDTKEPLSGRPLKTKRIEQHWDSNGAEPLPPADRVKSTVHAEATPPRGHTIAPDGAGQASQQTNSQAGAQGACVQVQQGCREEKMEAQITTLQKNAHQRLVAQSPVIEAAKHGQLSTMKKLLDGEVATVEDQDEMGMTALLWASRNGRLLVVRELVDIYKVNVFQKDKNGLNAMHKAAQGGHLEVIKFLSQPFGARICDRDNNDDTILHWTAYTGHYKVARYLIKELKMDPQDRDKWGATALLSAAFGGSVLVGKMLLEDFNSTLDEVANDSCHGMNALHFAASTGHLEMVKYLLPLYGEKKFNVDNNGDTCLDLAIKAKHKKVVDYLLQEAGFADQG